MSIRTGTLLEREDVFTRENLVYTLVAPGLFLFLAFVLYPMVYLLYLSFTNAEPATLFQGTARIIGFDNYVRIFTDPEFYNSLGITGLYVVTSSAIKVTFGLSVSLLLTSKYVLNRRFYRGLIILPMGIPPIVTISVWRGIFSSAQFGLANQVLQGLGMSPVGWLSQRWIAFLAYNVTHAWLAYPFFILITVSALQNVSGTLHDAARVDGAGIVARFVHVTWPAIKKPMLFATIYTAAASFQEFLLPFVLNEGGPGRTNELILLYGYREAFRYNRYGRGASIMIIALLFIAAFMYYAAKRGNLAEQGGAP